MTNSEIISLIAVCFTFLSILISFGFSYRKATKENDHEKETNVKNLTEIRNDIVTIKSSVSEIKYKVEKIDVKMQNDHEKVIEHETKIKNIEKEVFN